MVMNVHPILYFKSGPLPPRELAANPQPSSPTRKSSLLSGELKMSSGGVTSTEASLHVDGGIASRGKLNVSTEGLLGRSKSCVFIHVSLLQKFNTVAVSGKFQMRNIWSPRQCLSVVVASWFQAPGKIPSKQSR